MEDPKPPQPPQNLLDSLRPKLPEDVLLLINDMLEYKREKLESNPIEYSTKRWSRNGTLDSTENAIEFLSSYLNRSCNP